MVNTMVEKPEGSKRRKKKIGKEGGTRRKAGKKKEEGENEENFNDPINEPLYYLSQ